MAGVDVSNLFPNSRMALAVKLGLSQIRSVDAPTKIQSPSQINTSISTAGGTALTIPTTTKDQAPVLYAVITAIGGILYATYDGSAPSATNYDVQVASGSQLPVQGGPALAAIRVFGTTMSVSYWS